MTLLHTFLTNFQKKTKNILKGTCLDFLNLYVVDVLWTEYWSTRWFEELFSLVGFKIVERRGFKMIDLILLSNTYNYMHVSHFSISTFDLSVTLNEPQTMIFLISFFCFGEPSVILYLTANRNALGCYFGGFFTWIIKNCPIEKRPVNHARSPI